MNMLRSGAKLKKKKRTHNKTQRTTKVDRRNPDVVKAIEKFEEFYALPFNADECFAHGFLWPRNDKFMVVDRASRTGYMSDKWLEERLDEDPEADEFIEYTHEHDETPRPFILAVPETGEKGIVVEIPRPPRFAWSFLGYCLDIDANHLGKPRDRFHIDFKQEKYLPFLCWWERERALVILNAAKKDYPLIVQGPTLRIGPRGIEG